MSALRHFQRIVCVCLLGAMLAGPVCAQDVLDLIPEESLAVVRINKLDNTLGQLDKFLSGIAPMPVQMVIRGQLGQALGSAELNGVDMNGSFAAFAVAPEDSPEAGGLPPIYPGILIPVSDYDAFIKGNANCGDPDEHGVSAISGPGGSKNDTPWLIATKTGNYALVTMGKLYPQILKYQEIMGINTAASASMVSMSDSLVADDAKASRQQPVWIHGNVARASSLFKPLVDSKFAQFKEEISDTMAKASPSVGPVTDISAILDMYGAILDLFMEQTQSVSLTMDPKPDVLKIGKTVFAIPGSDLASMLIKDSTGQPNRLIGFAGDGAAMGFAGTLGESWKNTYVKSIDVLSSLLGDSMSPEAAARMKKLTTDMIDVLEGPMAGTLSMDGGNKPPFAMQYVFGVKDVDKFKGLLKTSVDLFNESGVTDLYRGMGLDMDYSMESGTATYRGVSIDSARMTMKSTQPDSPIGKSIEGMYGSGFDYRWAVTNKICAVAVGGDVDQQIHQMIDRIKAGKLGKKGNDMRAAFSVLPGADQADFVLTYNYARLIMGVLNTVRVMGEKVPEINVETTSHLSIAGWGGENRARFAMAVPKQHVMELVAVFTSLSQNNK